MLYLQICKQKVFLALSVFFNSRNHVKLALIFIDVVKEYVGSRIQCYCVMIDASVYGVGELSYLSASNNVIHEGLESGR